MNVIWTSRYLIYLLFNKVNGTKRKSVIEITEHLKLPSVTDVKRVCEEKNNFKFTNTAFSLIATDFIREKITSLACDTLVLFLQSILKFNLERNIREDICELHDMWYQKLNKKEVGLTQKLHKILSYKHIGANYRIVCLCKQTRIYMELFNQYNLVLLIQTYQDLITSVMQCFIGDPKTDYFYKFWSGRILKASYFKEYDSDNLLNFISQCEMKIKCLIYQID